jgi:hypothetical protein
MNDFDKEYFRSLDEFYVVHEIETDTMGQVFSKVHNVVFDDFLSAKEFVGKRLDEIYFEARKLFEKVELKNNYFYQKGTVDLPMKNNLYGMNSLFDFKIFVSKIDNIKRKEEEEYE